MRLLVGLLTCAVLATVAYGKDEPKWNEFNSKEGQFNILMPGRPKLDKQEVENRVYGKLSLHYTTADFGDGVSCSVLYVDYPPAIKNTPVKQMLDILRDGAVSGGKAKLLSEKEIKLNNHPGRAFHISRSEAQGVEAHGWVRIYLVDQRAYMVMIAGPKAAAAKEAEKFLDSFKLLGAAGAQDKPKREFQEITSKAGKYTVRMPGRPKELTQEDGTLKVFTQILIEADGVYMVTYSDFPEEVAKESAEMIQERLEQGRDNSIRFAAGKLVKSSKITLSGKHPGIEYQATITKPHKGIARTQSFLVGSRLYVLAVMGTEEFVAGADAPRFLDSFKLTD